MTYPSPITLSQDSHSGGLHASTFPDAPPYVKQTQICPLPQPRVSPSRYGRTWENIACLTYIRFVVDHLLLLLHIHRHSHAVHLKCPHQAMMTDGCFRVPGHAALSLSKARCDASRSTAKKDSAALFEILPFKIEGTSCDPIRASLPHGQ